MSRPVKSKRPIDPTAALAEILGDGGRGLS